MALNFLNNAYFAGTVGIGTETPGEKLEVNGNIKVIRKISWTCSGTHWNWKQYFWPKIN